MAKIKTTELLGVEPGLLLTSIVDNLAIDFTKEEIKKLSKYGFEKTSKKKTHYENEEYTLVKIAIVKTAAATKNFGMIAVPRQEIKSKDVYFVLLENDDYEFSLYSNLNFLNNKHMFEEVDADDMPSFRE